MLPCSLGTRTTTFPQVRKQVKLALEQLASSGSTGATRASAVRAMSHEKWVAHADRESVLPIGVPVVSSKALQSTAPVPTRIDACK